MLVRESFARDFLVSVFFRKCLVCASQTHVSIVQKMLVADSHEILLGIAVA